MNKQVLVNNEVARILGPSLGRQADFQSFAGTDITAMLYLPSITQSSLLGGQMNKKFKIFAELQTMSISTTRSVSPVRVLGRSSPIAYTRGARSIAGTLVFASINEDVFQEVYDESIAESTMAASTSLLSDQLPPFSIIITAANEKGGAAIQAVHGITLVNYGTTYSIDDLYTEVVYSYVATDLAPLSTIPMSMKRGTRDTFVQNSSYPDVSKLIIDSMHKAYGTDEEKLRAAMRNQIRGQDFV